MDFKKGYFDTEHTGRNGRFEKRGYTLPAGEKDTITGETARGTDDTYYAVKAKSGNADFPSRLFGLKSVDLDALYLDRTSTFDDDGSFEDRIAGHGGKLTESYCADCAVNEYIKAPNTTTLDA